MQAFPQIPGRAEIAADKNRLPRCFNQEHIRVISRMINEKRCDFHIADKKRSWGHKDTNTSVRVRQQRIHCFVAGVFVKRRQYLFHSFVHIKRYVGRNPVHQPRMVAVIMREQDSVKMPLLQHFDNILIPHRPMAARQRRPAVDKNMRLLRRNLGNAAADLLGSSMNRNGNCHFNTPPLCFSSILI